MRHLITIVGTALLASSLLTGAAEARGGGGFGGGLGGGGHIGGIGGSFGGHMGGLRGEHLGALGTAPHAGSMGRLGEGNIGAGMRSGANGLGLHQHALHRDGRRFGDIDPDCYDLNNRHPHGNLPLNCS